MCATDAAKSSQSCTNSGANSFQGFCIKNGQGTLVTIRGLGLTPTTDSPAVRLGDASGAVYTKDALNAARLHVFAEPQGDTVLYFYVPDREAGTRALEVALNGRDFTAQGVTFTHVELTK